MGDRSCFMQLGTGVPVAGGEQQMGQYQGGGGYKPAAGNKPSSNYQAKELQEEYCFGGGGGGGSSGGERSTFLNIPSNPGPARPQAPANPSPSPLDAGDRSCFMQLPGGR